MAIRTRLFLIVVLPSLLAFLLMAWLVHVVLEQWMSMEMTKRMQAVQRAWSVPCAIAMANGEWERLDAYMVSLMRSAPELDILDATILDRDGRVQSHSRPVAEYNQRLDDPFYNRALDSPHIEPRLRNGPSGPIMEYAAPLVSGMRWGTLIVTFSTARLQSTIGRMALLASLAMLIALMAMGLLVYINLSMAVANPVQSLTEASEKLAKLQFEDIEVDHFSGEFHRLAIAFSTMQRELESHTRELSEAIKDRTRELEEALSQVEALARTDGLTGIANYRHFKESTSREVQLAGRTRGPLSLLMIDVDFFKVFNDNHGHPSGDRALSEIGRVLSSCVRVTDIVARYGGEEFAVALVDTDAQAAKQVAEKIRRSVAALRFEHTEDQPGGRLTVSVGVATIPTDARDFDALVQMADQMLYKAKETGRDRVVVASECP
jgi:diguanylate cyclase (GGDEF)-like protein